MSTSDIDAALYVKTYSDHRQVQVTANVQQTAETRDLTRFRKVYPFVRQAPHRIRLTK
jgi:hypothetical protein